MMLFCLVVAYVIVRAWEQARAQARAEVRRAREHVAGEFAARMAAGEASSPLENWWWWPAAARRAWRAMRGPRQGARNTALPGRSPWRRVAQAAAAGATRGRVEGTRRARERRQRRREGRPAGGGRTPRGTGRAAGWAGFLAGWIAGQARWPHWGRPEFMPIGVCDGCGAVCALPSMAYQRVDAGGRTETWLLCAACRAEDAPEPAPVPLVVQVAVQVNAAVNPGHASDGPLSLQADNGGITGADPVPVPAGGPGQPAPAGQPLDAAASAEAAAVTDVPHGAIAAGASPTETSTDGGHVSTELELAGGNRLPARPGEAYNYGSWQRATESDAELLDALGLALEAMLSDLTAVSAGRTQTRNVTAWADRVRAEADLTREAIDEMDRRYTPVVATVAAVGGPDETSNSSYYREM
jgi:hypothetical protein